jgi:hypothetical protein
LKGIPGRVPGNLSVSFRNLPAPLSTCYHDVPVRP